MISKTKGANPRKTLVHENNYKYLLKQRGISALAALTLRKSESSLCLHTKQTTNLHLRNCEVVAAKQIAIQTLAIFLFNLCFVNIFRCNSLAMSRLSIALDSLLTDYTIAFCIILEN